MNYAGAASSTGILPAGPHDGRLEAGATATAPVDRAALARQHSFRVPPKRFLRSARHPGALPYRLAGGADRLPAGRVARDAGPLREDVWRRCRLDRPPESRYWAIGN